MFVVVHAKLCARTFERASTLDAHLAVSCSRYGPREIARRRDFTFKGQINCEFQFAQYSCPVRRQAMNDAEARQYSQLLEEALAPVVCLVRMPFLDLGFTRDPPSILWRVPPVVLEWRPKFLAEHAFQTKSDSTFVFRQGKVGLPFRYSQAGLRCRLEIKPVQYDCIWNL